ncbi:MAG: hypothetical protein ABJE47_20060 [bacterium]
MRITDSSNARESRPLFSGCVTCAGAVVGTALLRADGLAHALFIPTAAYDTIASSARELGALLSHRQYWAPDQGDFADALSERWAGTRLALRDELGYEMAAASVVVAEFAVVRPAGPQIVVIVDFRPTTARVPALHRVPLSS